MPYQRTPQLYDAETEPSHKQIALEKLTGDFSLSGAIFLSPSGTAADGSDYSALPCFTEAFAGKTIVTSSRDNAADKPFFMVSSPIWANGSKGGTVSRVVVLKVPMEDIRSSTDPSHAELATYHAKASAGESGYGAFKLDSVHQFIVYAPVPNTDGWSLCIRIPFSDFHDVARNTVQIS